MFQLITKLLHYSNNSLTFCFYVLIIHMFPKSTFWHFQLTRILCQLFWMCHNMFSLPSPPLPQNVYVILACSIIILHLRDSCQCCICMCITKSIASIMRLKKAGFSFQNINSKIFAAIVFEHLNTKEYFIHFFYTIL